jgi:uncharacterized protein YxeA
VDNEDDDSPFPTWAIILIVATVVVILIIILFFVFRSKSSGRSNPIVAISSLSSAETMSAPKR